MLRTFNDYQEDEELQLIKTKITKNHAWAGKTISELKLALDILVVMIKRGDQTILPNGRTRIKAGDILVLSGEMYKDDSGAELNEIEIGARHKWANKRIREITLPANTLIIAIKKKTAVLSSRGAGSCWNREITQYYGRVNLPRMCLKNASRTISFPPYRQSRKDGKRRFLPRKPAWLVKKAGVLLNKPL